MATTHDIADLKAQFDERIAHLRDSFGVVETDINRLGHFTQDFVFTSLEEHQRDNNDLNQVKNNTHSKSQEFVTALGADETALKTAFDALQKMFADGQTRLEAHVHEHEASHNILHESTQAFAGNIEQATGEADHARSEYIQHVQDMHQTLTGLAEKLSGSA